MDGIVRAIARGLGASTGRMVVIVDTSVVIDAEALVALIAVQPHAVVQPVVRRPDGQVLSAGARLLRPGALPWSDDRPVDSRKVSVFAADQPVFCLPGAARTAAVPFLTLPTVLDERVALCILSRALGAVFVADVGDVRRTEAPGRLIDDAVVDVIAGWRDLLLDPANESGLDSGPPLPPWGLRPFSPHRPTALRWSIKVAAPNGPDGDGWGDVSFAAELGRALERLGQRTRIDRRDQHVRVDDDDDDVMLSIRGLDRVPPNPGAVNLLWVISHPDAVADAELRAFDVVFAAGRPWAVSASRRAGVPVRTLFQATDPMIFRPGRAMSSADSGHVVFVGSALRGTRPIVEEAIRIRAGVRLHGPGWRGSVPIEVLGHSSRTRTEAAETYASARIVLNDHWPDMAAGGFVSNRVFDVLAAGGVVVTDPVVGLGDVIDVPTLAVASTPKELATLLDPHRTRPTAVERAATAARVAAEHSFAVRAEQLLAVALDQRARLHR